MTTSNLLDPTPPQHDRTAPAATYPCPEPDQMGALLHHVGIFTIRHTGWIRVTGTDRVRWLNGMVTNSIADLKPGEGNYSFALNAQGRIQGDLWAFAEQDSLLLKTSLTQVPAMIAMLERFIIMDDVELQDISEKRFGMEIVGPRAAELLQNHWIPKPGPARREVTNWNRQPIDVLSGHAPLVPRYELWVEHEGAGGKNTLQRMRDIITEASEPLGGRPVEAPAMEALRILEGTPRYGIDIRDRDLPQETAQTRALHFSKGCYLGQEIVERIRSRGNVHRTFGGFQLQGGFPTDGVLQADGKPVGELTSVSAIPLTNGILHAGLGYLRREALDRRATLTYASAQGAGIALPVPLPMRSDGSGSHPAGIRQQ